MLWVIIIGTALFIIYKITKESKEGVRRDVTSQGGMQVKYELLINHLTQDGNLRVTKLSSSSITLASPAAFCVIDNVAGDTEIHFRANLPPMGRVNKKWKFPRGYPQDKMIVEMESYFEWEKHRWDKAMDSFIKQQMEEDD